jgi:hypothetical protein
MAWNIYEAKFVAQCPSDGEQIEYTARIAAQKLIRVEDINAFARKLVSGYHEDIADKLFGRFGGMQCISAAHQGVKILTMREAGENTVSGREWAKEQLCS